MGKIKRSKKHFEGEKKAPWKKGIIKKKKFSPQRKKVLISYNIENSWFDHEEKS